mmetsp:Transcript_8594/g.35973  ORF Transcript_8594/g.35973 Transcript_8594/m.35973 type:complete len:501 (+) Transcript_8594:46-1548(+)
MAMGAGRGRVAPGDAPGENRAHEPSPPRFMLVRGETLIALVPDDEESASSLVVTREGPGRLRLESREKARALIADAPRVSSRAVYGCAGAVRTPSGVHLLVIKRCVRVGVVRGCAVFRAAAFDAVSCAPPGALEALSLAERRDEKKCLALLTKALDRKATALFFSGDPARYDATRSCARAAAAEQDEQPRTPWFAADHAFAWNSRCGETFLSEIFEISANADTNTQGVSLPQQQKQEEKASAFLVPLVCGSWRSARVAVAAKDEDQKKKKRRVGGVRRRLGRRARRARAPRRAPPLPRRGHRRERRQLRGDGADVRGGDEAPFFLSGGGDADAEEGKRRRECALVFFLLRHRARVGAHAVGAASARRALAFSDAVSGRHRWRRHRARRRRELCDKTENRKPQREERESAPRVVRADVRRVDGAGFVKKKSVVVRVAAERILRRRRRGGGDAREARVVRPGARDQDARRPRGHRASAARDGKRRGAARVLVRLDASAAAVA